MLTEILKETAAVDATQIQPYLSLATSATSKSGSGSSRVP
jgi:hypothetical protein